MIIVVFAIIALLAVVLFQDMKHRAIWWFLPPLVFAGGIVLQYPNFHFFDQLYSLLFIGALMAFLYVYIYFRFGNFDVFKSYFGIGDLLLLVAFVPFFKFTDYIFFFTFATLASLVLHGVVSLIRKQQSVPYAGYVSLALIGYLSLLYFFHLSIFSFLNV